MIQVNLNKQERIFRKGELIFREGDPINVMLYLKSGLVKLHKNILNRHDQIISIAGPLDFIGLLSVFSRETYLYSMTCIEESEICVIDLDIIRRLIEQNGVFAHSILKKMSNISDMVLERRLELSTKQLRGRVAFILLYFAGDIYRADHFDLPVSRKELAELVDMRTENVVRILSEFRRDGLIEIRGTRLMITDKELLEKIAEHG